MSSFSYLFGPVTSRRYGQSLGVDLAPMKTCTFSCRFCQLGPTPSTGLTTVRGDRPPIADVLAELKAYFVAAAALPDFVTASGSGEPTLHLHFGEVARFVHGETAAKALLLSNGSLFPLPEVRTAAALYDVVKVSLSAWDQASFEALMRPAPGLAFGRIVDGYRAFRQAFRGRLDCEVFLVPGFNDAPAACGRIAALVERFAPDTVSLNTAVRPGADGTVRPLAAAALESLRGIFGARAKPAGAEPPLARVAPTAAAVAALVERHPVSVPVLCRSTGLDAAALRRLLAGAPVRFFDAGGVEFVGNLPR